MNALNNEFRYEQCTMNNIVVRKVGYYCTINVCILNIPMYVCLYVCCKHMYVYTHRCWENLFAFESVKQYSLLNSVVLQL